MTLNEIVQEVISITNRPDREDFIRRQVRASITEVHGTAKYPRDRVEEVFVLNEPATLIKLTLPPRLKKFEVLGAVSNNGQPIALSTSNNQYERTDPAGLFDEGFQSKVDIYYVAGAVLNIRSSVCTPNIYAMYSTFPEVADNNLETWIMATQESLIIDLALSKVFETFGRDKEARSKKTAWQISNQEFMFNNIIEGSD
jgi:hypothetical protein